MFINCSITLTLAPAYRTKEKLAKIEKKIDELEDAAKNAGSKVRADAKKGLKELKQKREVLKKNMKKLEAGAKGNGRLNRSPSGRLSFLRFWLYMTRILHNIMHA